MNENLFMEVSNDLKERVHNIRYSFFEDIDQHMLRFENKLSDRNVDVLWAPDETKLIGHIESLLPKHVNDVCFDMPSLSMELFSNPSKIRQYSAESVASKEKEVDLMVINADFAIAEDGSLVFVNRATQDCFNFVKELVVVVNVDSILIKHSDLSMILPLLNSENGSYPSDVKFLNGPFRRICPDSFTTSDSPGYTEMPVKLTVIIYENGISDILPDIFLRESLYCINCGRCLKVCPVANQSHHIAPIQIVKNNCLDKYNNTQSIFAQTSLCGMCEDVCPINIPLADLLQYEMNIISSRHANFTNKQIFNIFSKRKSFNKMNNHIFRFFWTKMLFGKNKQMYNYFKENKSTFYNIQNEQVNLEMPNENEF